MFRLEIEGEDAMNHCCIVSFSGDHAPGFIIAYSEKNAKELCKKYVSKKGRSASYQISGNPKLGTIQCIYANGPKFI